MSADSTPVFQQLAERIADGIITGAYPEGSAVPSLNELAVFYRMNQITAAKGINLLVEQGLLTKKRGVGMFVTEGAQERLREDRRSLLRERYVVPFLREAQLLGITTDEIQQMVSEEIHA